MSIFLVSYGFIGKKVKRTKIYRTSWKLLCGDNFQKEILKIKCWYQSFLHELLVDSHDTCEKNRIFRNNNRSKERISQCQNKNIQF